MANRLTRFLTGPTEAELAGVQASTPPPSAPVAPPGAGGGVGSPWGPWGVGYGTQAPFMVPPSLGQWWGRSAAMSIPTVSRARDLICSAVAALPLRAYRLTWGVDDYVVEPVEPMAWCLRPDPQRTRAWFLAYVTDSMIFHGDAWLAVTDRYSTGYPRAFRLMDHDAVTVGADGTVREHRVELDPGDVVQVLSPIEGLLSVGWRAIATALQLDAAAARYAVVDTPSGWLQQTEGDPLDGPALAADAASWHAARLANQTGALNTLYSYHESSLDPGRLQLTEARAFAALELSRLANVPPYLVGAEAGGSFTYSNAQQARGDLIDFGALPYILAIEQTLSGPNVTPAGTIVRLDLQAWLRSPLTGGTTPPDVDPAVAPSREVVP